MRFIYFTYYGVLRTDDSKVRSRIDLKIKEKREKGKSVTIYLFVRSGLYKSQKL